MDGVLVIAKPTGPTSHDVVGLIRRLTATKRVGHGGTLDPFASGVLPVFLGAATRLPGDPPRGGQRPPAGDWPRRAGPPALRGGPRLLRRAAHATPTRVLGGPGRGSSRLRDGAGRRAPGAARSI